jgi:hypothetical protein
MKKKINASQRPSPDNVFKSALDDTDDLKDGFQKGLKALKGDSHMVTVTDGKKLMGSVDIDECTKYLYPNDARWDYAIGYGKNAYFVEVHPANTSNVNEMINKAKWLDNWLKYKACHLAQLRKDKANYWIPSGKVKILPNSAQYRNMAKCNLIIKSVPFNIG